MFERKPRSRTTPPVDLDDVERVDALHRDIRLRLAREYAKRKNVLRWGQCLFPDKFPLPFCPFHHYLVSTRHVPKTGTEGPRNHAKTAIECFLVPIFQGLEEPTTFDHYLNIQATGLKANAVNLAIRNEIEGNDIVHEMYGNQVGEDKWTDGQFALKNGVCFTAAGAGQSIRGMMYLNRRPSFIIVDDLYDEEDIEKPDGTAKKNKWVWSSLFPARAKSRRNCFHVQGTAINDADILKEISKKVGWSFRSFDAITSEKEKTALWPELNSYDQLMADKVDMGTIIFERELRNRRRDDAESIIKMRYLEGWEYDPEMLRAELMTGRTRRLEAVILSCDPSIGKTSESDESGFALVLKTGWVNGDGGNEWWIERSYGMQMTLNERVAKLEEWAAGQPKGFEITDVRIEAIAGFDDFAQTVINNTNLPVTRVEQVKDKITNRVNVSRHFENRKVHCAKTIPEADREKLIAQLVNNHPQHDDVFDATQIAISAGDGLWRFV